MTRSYRTPGVYPEELSKLPPSVAPVATAIPAFIGYTEKAAQNQTGDLLRKPTKITAIAEYEQFFGGPFLEKGFKANVADTINPVSGLLTRSLTVPKPTMSDFMLWYSVRIYFANGGGPCYIIAVDTYRDGTGNLNAISLDALGNNSSGTGGLDLLELEDEPTLILFPDAQALPQKDYYSLCQTALAQCNKLQDRFALLDTQGDTDAAPTLFRNYIGNNFLKYGATYYPFLDTALNYAYREEDVTINYTPEPTFALPAKAVNDIETQLGNIQTAQTTIGLTNTGQLSREVTGANTKADKKDKLPPIKTQADILKIQVDSIIDALQIITNEASDINSKFHDPDITTAIHNLNTRIYRIYASGLTEISERVADAISRYDTDPGTITLAQIDTIATDFFKRVDGGAPATAPYLKDDVNKLIATQIPALITAIEGNNPTVFIPRVNKAFTDAVNARNIIATIPLDDLVKSVILPAVADSQALDALKNNLGPANTIVINQITVLIDALTTIKNAIQDVAEIAFLRNLLSSVKAIDATQLAAINTQLSTIDTGITAAVAGTIRSGLNSLANTFNDQMQALAGEIKLVFITLINLRNAIDYLDLNNKTLKDIESIDNNTYNQIKLEISKITVNLPPSGAIAGIYAQVDRDRGVWQAPANVSLASVIGPTKKINNDIQDGFNVDPVAGKSINAIRSFSGRGTMVWGCRTLAGNDNEWRYVSVRRFYNFAEVSIKKATEPFVFLANDANTWVKVRALIENFLTLQWRAGALAGEKPEQAFYVRVGLGQTMTSLDILEGRMNVEIGMAVVRPTEFIILKFSHKMQEA